jgi:hypothetical protein
MDGDVAYLLRRASEERAAAMRARHPNARQSHLELAARYQEMADAIIAREQFFGIKNEDDSAGPLSA